jgi:hypothetical protein
MGLKEPQNEQGKNGEQQGPYCKDHHEDTCVQLIGHSEIEG